MGTLIQIMIEDGKVTMSSVITEHGALSGLANDDHKQYLPVDPVSRSLNSDLDASSHKITHLTRATGNGEAVSFEQAIKVGDPAGGDLGGTYPVPSVVRLQGKDVSPDQPKSGDVLTWIDDKWKPSQLPQPEIEGEYVKAVAGAYAIVAAGWFKDDGKPQGPVYNGLAARKISDGKYQLIFKTCDFKSIPKKVQYIVKGTVHQPEGRDRATFELVGFTEKGIIISVLQIDNKPSPQMGFMVEICAFGLIS